MQQRAAGQTAEDHRRHQLVHVDLLRTPLTEETHTRSLIGSETRGVGQRHKERTPDLLGTSMQDETDLLLDSEDERAEASLCIRSG